MEDSNKKLFLDWIEQKSGMQSILSIPNISGNVRRVVDEHEQYSYDSRISSAKLCIQVQGTQYEGRGPRIESISKGDVLKLSREPNNPHSSNTISVQNGAGQSLGNLPAELADLLSPLLDEGKAELHGIQADYVEPLSKRSSKVKKALLYVSFTVKLNKTDYRNRSGCIVCLLGGEQGCDFLRKIQAFSGNYDTIMNSLWVQKLRVLHCRMEVEQAKLVFELYNRYFNEYDENKNDDGYFGLDNLEDEVVVARKKMREMKKDELDYSGPKNAHISLIEFARTEIEKDRERYGSISNCFAVSKDERWSFQRIFEKDSIGDEIYYWVDQTPVSNTKFQEIEAQGAFGHWYDVAELFSPEGVPVDLEDEDVVSIFGTDKFLAFADLSYGC